VKPRRHSHRALVFESVTGGLNLFHTFRNRLISADPHLAWCRDGHTLASTADAGGILLWNLNGNEPVRVLLNHHEAVTAIAWCPSAQILASASSDKKIYFWNPETGELLHDLLLATARERDDEIRIWSLDAKLLLSAGTRCYYRNAKVVLVGDTGVGKTGLSCVLTGNQWEPTGSTHGRFVKDFERSTLTLEEGGRETREILLWDLAGQPGYRLVHQMHLNEVAVALVVFDARTETDPLAGIRHWSRALGAARRRQGSAAVPLKKFLVDARVDCGGISISKDRVEELRNEMGFDGYFETSAKEGWGIEQLASTVRANIPWGELPRITATEVFEQMKQFVRDEKGAGRILSTADELFRVFKRARPELDDEELRTMFDTCLGRLENRDLIRRLTFGRYVLLQPELLDAYASALIDAAKEEPNGFGSIAEEVALAGKFRMSEDSRIANKGQEEIILVATLRELLEHDLVTTEPADDGKHLVFPSQFMRTWPDEQEPPGKVLTCYFEGPTQHIYATLAVRLGHSGFFETDRTGMWFNAAKYRAKGWYVRLLPA
jgi:small GTP-binding protein